MKIRMEQCGPERGDCTAPYQVTIVEGGTVNDFIKMILSTKKEWGYIGIEHRGAIFGDPNMEYRRGKCTGRKNLKDYKDLEVKKITADGGYTRMDYILTVCKDVLTKEQGHE